MEGSLSQRRADGGVELLAKTIEIDPGKARPVLEYHAGLEWWDPQRSQLGDRSSRSRDGEFLAGNYTVDDLTAVIAEISDAHFRVGHKQYCITRETSSSRMPVGPGSTCWRTSLLGSNDQLTRRDPIYVAKYRRSGRLRAAAPISGRRAPCCELRLAGTLVNSRVRTQCWPVRPVRLWTI